MNDLMVVITAKVVHNQNDVVAEDSFRVMLPKLDKKTVFDFEAGLVGLGEAQKTVPAIATTALEHVIWKAHRALGLELNKQHADEQAAAEAARVAEEEEADRLKADALALLDAEGNTVPEIAEATVTKEADLPELVPEAEYSPMPGAQAEAMVETGEATDSEGGTPAE